MALKPTLIKDEIELPINVISGENFRNDQVFKTKIHTTLGDTNSYEFVGKGDRRMEIPVWFNDEDEYNTFISFFDDGKPFLINVPFFPLEPVNLDGDISSEPNYNGFRSAKFKITTAVNVDFDTENLFALGVNSETLASEKTFLDKMFDFGTNSFNFVSNTNQAIGSVTNQVAIYASAATNIAQGLASSSSIITNPINSIRSSAQQLIGGINNLITSISTSINAIRQVPGDISSLIDSLSLAGSRLNNLFDLGDSSSNAKYNTEFLLETGSAIVDASEVDPANSLQVVNGEFTDAEYLLNIQNDNINTLSAILLGSILINIYSNVDKISSLSQKDLNRLRVKSEKIYDKINDLGIDSDFTLQLDLARNKFYKIFIILSKRAANIYRYNVVDPEFLVDIVFAVNGNLDFYEETKKLNNIIGDLVYEPIDVIRNV